MTQHSTFEIPAPIVEKLSRAIFGTDVPARLELTSTTERVNGTISEARLCVDGRTQPLIIKIVDLGLFEAAKYRALGTAGAPVAKLYADFAAADGREVLLLERLPRIGVDAGEREFGLYIDALARFNAAPAAGMPHTTPGWLREWLAMSRTAWQRARSGAWGRELERRASALDANWPALEALAAQIESELAAFPLDVIHQDPSFENCGWREDGTLVFLDLSYVSRFPALCDLAICLGACNQPWPSARGRAPWIERYCQTYNEAAPAQQLSVSAATRGVILHQAASVLWLNQRTFERGDAWLSANHATAADNNRGRWLARTWRRMRQMLDEGIEMALVDQTL